MAFEIEFDPEAVKDLRKLDRSVQKRLVGFLKLRVATLDDPRSIGEALAGSKLAVTGSTASAIGGSSATFRIVASSSVSCA